MSARFTPAMTVQGHGPVVVFLHGVGGGKASYDRQLPIFAAAGYRAAAFDSPGYGDNPPVESLSWDALADAVLAGIDALGVEKVALVGHSMGGMVAQEVAARAPERLWALVLSGTSPAFGNRDGAFQKKFVADRLGPLDDGKTMPELAASIVASLVGPDPDPVGKAAAIACMSAVPDATYRAAMTNLVTFDRRAALAQIAVPTLVLAGEHDTNAPAPMMEKMASRIPGAVYRCLAGAGHLSNFERPADFDAAVLAFLNSVKEH